ncbi:hypothetical protein THTE_2147 [Thermogutta terrifontis]|uniref:Uncharacterized protein n=1 Tax=Thermogutta terrifontis TaxID=1331910 RepID=A0A286RFK8_9BACT|nr:hypothetical protein THTE_2147 [Thermogutta terrifontis]
MNRKESGLSGAWRHVRGRNLIRQFPAARTGIHFGDERDGSLGHSRFREDL